HDPATKPVPAPRRMTRRAAGLISTLVTSPANVWQNKGVHQRGMSSTHEAPSRREMPPGTDPAGNVKTLMAFCHADQCQSPLQETRERDMRLPGRERGSLNPDLLPPQIRDDPASGSCLRTDAPALRGKSL